MIDLDRLLVLGRESRARIGVGAPDELVDELRERLSASSCVVHLLGLREPEGLVSALNRGVIDGAIRGTLSSANTLKAIRSEFALKSVERTAVLEDRSGKKFLLTPVGIDEGRTVEDREQLATGTVSYFASVASAPRIGVLSKGRLEDVGRGEEIRSSIEEGELLARKLRDQGHQAEHYGILIEDAVRECELVVAPDGVSGNLIFRSIHFLGGMRAYGAPVVNMDKVFVDTSRAKADFSDSVLLAAGLAEMKSEARSRA